MNSKLALSIALTSVVTLNSAMAFADTPPETPVKAEASSQNGGKCAAGKCGTEKRFEKRELDSDPQDRLVRARDGKCGITGQGIKPTPERISDKNRKITEGVCGQ
ncbi:hypothetical protein VISI1226_20984 [Vibrio sinaloensis DSM 21326]|uniref:Secreted protein n=1 Tax=Vibrio sinaloensis DSM 21326 TaxID=945550 RepID=E8MAS4_PHOS4|nr:hypothetical protein [Vibrio sinaloensis]EGA68919.1 hypothetical protein VISI1226_20984 [Vibrio sinaloensis DSM 21326]